MKKNSGFSWIDTLVVVAITIIVAWVMLPLLEWKGSEQKSSTSPDPEPSSYPVFKFIGRMEILTGEPARSDGYIMERDNQLIYVRAKSVKVFRRDDDTNNPTHFVQMKDEYFGLWKK